MSNQLSFEGACNKIEAGVRGAHSNRAKAIRRREKFIKALAVTGNVTEACEIANVRREIMYRGRKTDPEFSALWEIALDTSTDLLEGEARRRAMGFKTTETKTITDDKGNVIEHITEKKKYSDGLLSNLLRAKRPQEFDRKGLGVKAMGESRAAVVELTDDALVKEIKKLQVALTDRKAIDCDIVEPVDGVDE